MRLPPRSRRTARRAPGHRCARPRRGPTRSGIEGRKLREQPAGPRARRARKRPGRLSRRHELVRSPRTGATRGISRRRPNGEVGAADHQGLDALDRRDLLRLGRAGRRLDLDDAARTRAPVRRARSADARRAASPREPRGGWRMRSTTALRLGGGLDARGHHPVHAGVQRRPRARSSADGSRTKHSAPAARAAIASGWTSRPSSAPCSRSIQTKSTAVAVSSASATSGSVSTVPTSTRNDPITGPPVRHRTIVSLARRDIRKS